MRSEMNSVRALTVAAAALMLNFCGGEDAHYSGTAGPGPGAPVEAPDRAGVAASGEAPTGQAGEPAGGPAGQPGAAAGDVAGPPGPVAGTSGPRVSRLPAAPYYFAHARFVLARDAGGRPLGIRVEDVLSGGRVALAGILVGDLIHSINLVPMDDPATFDRAVRIAEDIFKEGRPQHFVVTREGRKMGLMPLGPLATEPVPNQQP